MSSASTIVELRRPRYDVVLKYESAVLNSLGKPEIPLGLSALIVYSAVNVAFEADSIDALVAFQSYTGTVSIDSTVVEGYVIESAERGASSIRSGVGLPLAVHVRTAGELARIVSSATFRPSSDRNGSANVTVSISTRGASGRWLLEDQVALSIRQSPATSATLVTRRSTHPFITAAECPEEHEGAPERVKCASAVIATGDALSLSNVLVHASAWAPADSMLHAAAIRLAQYGIQTESDRATPAMAIFMRVRVSSTQGLNLSWTGADDIFD